MGLGVSSAMFHVGPPISCSRSSFLIKLFACNERNPFFFFFLSYTHRDRNSADVKENRLQMARIALGCLW
jgi:hypothetical protein